MTQVRGNGWARATAASPASASTSPVMVRAPAANTDPLANLPRHPVAAR
jgi:hypothetical protein